MRELLNLLEKPNGLSGNHIAVAAETLAVGTTGFNSLQQFSAATFGCKYKYNSLIFLKDFGYRSSILWVNNKLFLKNRFESKEPINFQFFYPGLDPELSSTINKPLLGRVPAMILDYRIETGTPLIEEHLLLTLSPISNVWERAEQSLILTQWRLL